MRLIEASASRSGARSRPCSTAWCTTRRCATTTSRACARISLRRRADAARDDREGARGAADRAELRERLRADRDPRRRDAERRQGPARRARPRSGVRSRCSSSRIVDEEGKRAARRRSSASSLIRGPTVTPGYWNRPDATAEAVRDGWLHTGDLGYRDAEGFYFVRRPRQGHDHPRRRERVLHRDRELPRGPPGDRRGRGRRRARRGARRAREGDRAPRARARSSRRGRARATSPRTSPPSRCRSSSSSRDEPLPRNPAGKLLKNLLRGQRHRPLLARVCA